MTRILFVPIILCNRLFFSAFYLIEVLVFILIEQEIFLRRIVWPYLFDTFIYITFVLNFLQILKHLEWGARADCVVDKLVLGCGPGSIFQL